MTGRFLCMFFFVFSTACSVFGIRSEEQPIYEVIVKDGDKEIRKYEPYVIAKTTVKGEYKQAQTQAFRKLAGYIFGDNSKETELSMTAPVVQKPESESIAMTAPVTQKRAADDSWTMSFVMPSKYKMEDLPKPNQEGIEFEQIPSHFIAAIQYAWLSNEEKNRSKAEELMDWIAGKQSSFKMISEPKWAGYDPPWTLPPFRRNEIMIQVEKDR